MLSLGGGDFQIVGQEQGSFPVMAYYLQYHYCISRYIIGHGKGQIQHLFIVFLVIL